MVTADVARARASEANEWCACACAARDDSRAARVALSARVEELGRRHAAAARALVDARARAEEAKEESARTRERGDAAAAACQAMKRELTRARRLNLDAERRATFELERGARARKTLAEMVRELKSELKESREATKEASARAGAMEEWARRCDGAKREGAFKLTQARDECSALRQRMQTLAEENVRLRRRAMVDRRDMDEATNYGERLEREWSTRKGDRVVVRNPIFTDISDSSDENTETLSEQTP